MENSQLSEKDQLLWRQAKKRVGFRRHLFVYIIINAFIWAMWAFRFFNMDVNAESETQDGNWHRLHFHGAPVLMTLGWGIGLAFHFYSAYIDPKFTAVQREYEKLRNSGK